MLRTIHSDSPQNMACVKVGRVDYLERVFRRRVLAECTVLGQQVHGDYTTYLLAGPHLPRVQPGASVPLVDIVFHEELETWTWSIA